ncbi:ATP synthase F1 subunit delta [Spirochaeta cellobiosiphila]|uniref:ATP synthase F1 subunit delta n=1 Tax=Spirochaeta cellobiosiphila TaxID=504483 RepID=UPI00040B9450|nr:ATP synthase F1 subunit delta [Spirochaeta cellobiosiphila]
MKGIERIQRYAQALYEVAAKQGVLENIQQDMDYIEEIVGSSEELHEFFHNTKNYSLSDKKVLDTVFIPYVHELTANTIKLLKDNKRLSALPLLPKAYRDIDLMERNITEVTVESASPLDEETKKQILNTMKNKVQGDVLLKESLQPSIIGGVRIIWNNRMIDHSLKGRLKALKVQLSR